MAEPTVLQEVAPQGSVGAVDYIQGAVAAATAALTAWLTSQVGPALGPQLSALIVAGVTAIAHMIFAHFVGPAPSPTPTLISK